jgi:hypothetical protein
MQNTQEESGLTYNQVAAIAVKIEFPEMDNGEVLEVVDRMVAANETPKQAVKSLHWDYYMPDNLV